MLKLNANLVRQARIAPQHSHLQAIAERIWQRHKQRPDLSRRETLGLIGSDKVEGTEVHRSNGDFIGTDCGREDPLYSFYGAMPYW